MKNIVKDWTDYVSAQSDSNYECGFIEEAAGFELCYRSRGTTYVYPLEYPRTFGEYLDLVFPEAEIKLVVEELAESLKEAKARLSLRNRQIRDLRRQLRKQS